MPVHRLPGGRGRVLANVAELDAWKRSGAVQTTEPQPAAPPPVPVIDAPPAAARPVRRHFAAGLGIAALVAVALLAVHYWPRKPVSYRVERDTFIALDAQGRECWRKVFPYPLMEANSPELSSRYTWIGDLDGDGRNEVLFAPHFVASHQESTPLICYDDRGVERWRFENRRRVRTSTEDFAPIFGLAGFLVTPRGRGLANVVLVATTHYLYYPSQVVLLEPDGRLVGAYWHSGHLNFLQAADPNNDGKTKFYLAGISNAWHAATLVVLDPDRFVGSVAGTAGARLPASGVPPARRARSDDLPTVVPQHHV